MKNFRSQIDVFFIVGVLVTFIVSAVIDVFSMMQISLGVFLIMFAPGYLVLIILFPERTKINFLERIVFSIVISFSEVILLAYTLNSSIWGITKWAFIIGHSIVIISLVFASVAQRIYHLNKKQDIFEIEFNILAIFQNIMKFDKIEFLLFFVLLLSILTTAIVSLYGFGIEHVESFSEFYIVGSEGFLDNYPDRFYVNEPLSVTVEVENHEGEKINYAIIAMAGDKLVGILNPFEVLNDERREGNLEIVLPEVGENVRIDILLVVEGFDYPYRGLTLWVNVVE